MINGLAAPLFSASANKIVAQVPWDAAIGLAEVIVRRSGVDSRPARFTISAIGPVVRTADGYGPVSGNISGQSLTISASGLGLVDSSINSGDAGPADTPAKPTANIQAFIGGIRTNVSAALSRTQPGVFDVVIDVPAGARPGDLVNLVVGNRAANRTVFQPISAPDIQFVPAPDGAADIRELTELALQGSGLAARKQYSRTTHNRPVISGAASAMQGCDPALAARCARAPDGARS